VHEWITFCSNDVVRMNGRSFHVQARWEVRAGGDREIIIPDFQTRQRAMGKGRPGNLNFFTAFEMVSEDVHVSTDLPASGTILRGDVAVVGGRRMWVS